MNTVILMGRLVDDVDLSTFKSKDGEKKSNANFVLAVDRRGKDAGADFIRCVAFGATADFISDYFKKGQRALVRGAWRTGSFEDKEGNVRYTNDCIIDVIEFADSKKESTEEKKDGKKRK